LTDTFTDGQPVNLFESGSIMLYLVERYDNDFKLSFPRGSREAYELYNWLFFQNAGLGPMQGQASHFIRYAPESIPYSKSRYQNETRRLYGVLEKHLKEGKREWIVGDKFTIVDIAHFAWIENAFFVGVDLTEFPALKGWVDRIKARPAVQRGLDVPYPSKMRGSSNDEAAAEEFTAWTKDWIQRGMKEDAKKGVANL
jgi:glutathione S-transferase